MSKTNNIQNSNQLPQHNTMTPESKVSITIHLDQDDATALEIPIEIISRDLGLDRETTIARVLLFGAVSVLANNIECLKQRNKCQQGIIKLKAGEYASNEELEAVVSEAHAGYLPAQIIMEDFKRFGRSMEKM